MIYNSFKINPISKSMVFSMFFVFLLLPSLIDFHVYAQKRLTQEKILKLPEGIINMIPYPGRWDDNDNFVFFAGTGASFNEIGYNLKSGLSVSIKPAAKSQSVNKKNETISIRDIGQVRNYTLSPDSSKIAYVLAFEATSVFAVFDSNTSDR